MLQALTTVREAKGLLKRHVVLCRANSRVLKPPVLAKLDMAFDRIVTRNILWAEERVALIVCSPRPRRIAQRSGKR